MERGDHIRVPGFSGVACVYLGPGKRWEPCMVYVEDEDGNEVEIEDPYGEGEWIDDPSIALIRMVGDDHTFRVDPDDCKPLDEDAFCRDCGQIACMHGRAS